MLNRAERKFYALALGAIAITVGAFGCAHPHVRTLEAYRAAKKRHDYDAVRKYLADDARIWHDKKEGPGKPLRVTGGPYADWDRVMNGTSTQEEVEVRGNCVTYLSTETNDYYKSLERTTYPARITHYFGEGGKITGMFYDPMRESRGPAEDRRDEFDAWANAKYPGLLESEEMKIPKNPGRWRELLIEWREDAGLPRVVE